MPPPPRRFRPLRLLGRLFGLLVIAALLGFGYVYVSNKAFRQTLASVVVGANPRVAFGRSAITLLVLGKDEDRDHRDKVLQTNARSDTIILARLDFAANRMDLLSVPRDTRVHIPGTRGYSKINAAHAIGGWEKTAETLQDFLGVVPDKAVVVDYDMLRKVIDELGGVTVNVDKQLDYDDNWGNLHIHLKPGPQTLNGTQAMGFVRFRHANEGTGDSDFVRIERQQMLLQAVKTKLWEPATWVRIPAVLETVRREMRGSLTYSQLVALASFARGVPKANITMHVLPSRPGRSFVYPDRDAARALVARLFPANPDAAMSSSVDEEAPRPRRRARRTRRTTQVAPVAAGPATEQPADATGETVEPGSSLDAGAAPAPLVDPEPAMDTTPEPDAPAEPRDAAPADAPSEHQPQAEPVAPVEPKAPDGTGSM